MDTSDHAWHQARLSLCRGGLRLSRGGLGLSRGGLGLSRGDLGLSRGGLGLSRGGLGLSRGGLGLSRGGLGQSRGGLGLSRGGLGLSRGGLGLSRGGLGLSRGGLGLGRGGLGLSRGGLGLSRGGLGLSRGGLGLRSLTQHSPTAYIALLCTSGFGSQSQHHLASAIQLFNSSVPPSEAINSEVLLLTLITLKSLSSKLDNHLFKVLLDMSSVADKARLLPSCSITAISHSFRGSWSPS